MLQLPGGAGGFGTPTAKSVANQNTGTVAQGVGPYNVPTAAPAPSAPAAPNWQELLANNPYLLAQQALSAQQLAALKAHAGAAAARALVNLGDASLAGKVGGLDIPGGTGGLVDQANKAGTSVLSQLGYSHNQNQQQIPATLAGRGFYRSGETGYELGQENRQYGLKQESARQQTLDYLNQLYDNYVNSQFGIQQNNLNAYFQAYQQALAQIAAGGVPAGEPAVAGVETPPPPPSNPNSLSSIKSQLGYGSSQPWTAGL
jgi:hypothetical protein